MAFPRKLHILVAEDNLADEYLVREALAKHGIDADLTVHRDGEEMMVTIERIDAEQIPCPDLVLLDLNLPKRNGEFLLARIRQSPLCGNVPVIIVTSSNAPKDRESTSRMGASSYFCKPSDYDQFMILGSLVKEVLQLRAA